MQSGIVAEDKVKKCDHLNGLAQTHRVRQNATKALTSIELGLILHQIFKEETHTTHLDKK